MEKIQHTCMISNADLIDAKLGGHHYLCGSKHCPRCGQKLQYRPDLKGLPAGVKFDPTDHELIEHLEAKVQSELSKSHPLIDEFIPTIEGEDGICYTHPEKLPGVTKNGLSRHFFHRPSKAYTTGTRKRRKVQTGCDVQGGETRWHKTGKTRPVMVNGRHKGCKKILVLYTNFGKHRKPEKTNWVMHQYHIGQHEEEREGELVVSKIFYQTQPRQCNWAERNAIGENIGSQSSDQIFPANSRSSNDANGDRCPTEAGTRSSSSKEIIQRVHDQIAQVAMPSYSALDMQQMKTDAFSFSPFRRSFDESAEISEVSTHTSEEHEKRGINGLVLDQINQQVAAAPAFHISRTSNPVISSIFAPPIHQTSLVLDDSFHMSRLILQNEKIQNQQQQPKLASSTSYKLPLEEMFDCAHQEIKESTLIGNTPEDAAEWIKHYWHDPNHPHHA